MTKLKQLYTKNKFIENFDKLSSDNVDLLKNFIANIITNTTVIDKFINRSFTYPIHELLSILYGFQDGGYRPILDFMETYLNIDIHSITEEQFDSICANLDIYKNIHKYNQDMYILYDFSHSDGRINVYGHIFNELILYEDIAEIYDDINNFIINSQFYNLINDKSFIYDNYDTILQMAELIQLKIPKNLYPDNIFKDNLDNDIQNFLYLITDSNKFCLLGDLESYTIEECIDEDEDFIIIISTLDNKKSLFNINRTNHNYEFIVDITDNNGDNFSFKSAIKNKEHLNILLRQTANALKNYTQFNKYAVELDEIIQ